MAITLGIIPSWQFDPSNTINMNQHLTFPPGMNQLTVQPINNVVPSGDANLQGLGTPMATWLQPAVGVPRKQLGNVFTTWWFTNRKWLMIGAASILGVGAAVVAGKVLK